MLLTLLSLVIVLNVVTSFMVAFCWWYIVKIAIAATQNLWKCARIKPKMHTTLKMKHPCFWLRHIWNKLYNHCRYWFFSEGKYTDGNKQREETNKQNTCWNRKRIVNYKRNLIWFKQRIVECLGRCVGSIVIGLYSLAYTAQGTLILSCWLLKCYYHFHYQI